VDELAGFLDGPRARGAFTLRAVMEPPWSIRIEDEAPLSVVVMSTGTAVVVGCDGHEHELGPGDVALIRGPEPYLFADSTDTPVQVLIRPGQICVSPAGEDLSAAMDLGVRTWGNDAGGSTVMLVGTYQADGEISRRLTDALPPVVVARSASSVVQGLLTDQIGVDRPGQQVVLDRLLDLVVIEAVREWFGQPGTAAPSWYAARADPVVGPAVSLIHELPQHPWTVAELASQVGVSRAALARRFAEVVGEPPMTYLSGWRLALAADLMLEPGASVGAVSRQVGYGSPFTFSTAFKRAFGHSPRAHRSLSLRVDSAG